MTLTATAQADYLPPAQLGARLNYFGDKVEGLQDFSASFNGPSELKELGDPYVYCEEGPAYTTTLDGTTTYPTYNGNTTNHPQYTDGITNHCGVPNPGVTQGNPDQQPPGYSGTATSNTGNLHPGGYNYAVTIPAGIGAANIWVYNPSFIPCIGACGSYTTDKFESSNGPYYQGPNGTGILPFKGYYDAPPFYFDITYSLYRVNSLYDRSSDTPVMPVGSVTYQPYDAMSGDLGIHGCAAGSQVYDPYWHGGGTLNYYNPGSGYNNSNGCLSLTPGGSPSEQTAPAACWEQWCTVFTGLPDGYTYRLVIEATGLTSSVPGVYSSDSTSGYGQHYYALKVCSSTDTSPIGCSNEATGSNPGLQISAWNDMDVYYVKQLGQATPDASNPSTSCVFGFSAPTPYSCVDLACFPTAYAGRTLSVQIYDPGDGSSNDIYVGVAEAGVGTGDVTYPGLTTTPIDGDNLVQVRNPSYDLFNGLWLTASIALPSTYTGDCLPNGTGWWQMVYASTDSNPSDSVAVKVSLAGSPVHLVTPG